MEKTVIITGVSSGVGKALAELLIKEEGYRIIGLSRRKPEELSKISSGNFFWHFSDFSLPESMQVLCQDILSRYGKIDLLIHCAGEASFKKFDKMDDELVKKIIHVNLTSPLLLTKNIIPFIKENGQVIFVTSSAAQIPAPLSAVYAVAKKAQEYLVESLNIEYTKSGIKFKILRPGLIKTDFLNKAGVPKEEISLRFAQSPEKVASNLLKLIKNNGKIKNSGLPNIISIGNYICPWLLRYLVKRIYLKRLKRIR